MSTREPPASPEPEGWHFWIDRGGTFTDVVARNPEGGLKSLKLLSDDPVRYEDAAVEAVRRCLDGEPPERRRIAAVRMGTTVATNALLERRGEPTLLVVTAGLRDVLRIGTQQRPDIFALDIRLPDILYADVVEARERVSARGEIVAELDLAQLESDLAAAHAKGLDSVAIALLHGYRFPEHEKRAGALAAKLGFRQISLSHETLPLMKLVPRGDTTLADAYLGPVLRRYVAAVEHGLEKLTGRRPPILFMQSHGGLARANFFRGKDSILSGPAGGVIGMTRTSAAAGFHRVLGFDMGGTSTDVSLFAGELERTTEDTVAGVRIAAPMLRIHTVAAGGGSIVEFESGRLQVGPRSAGAHPGPACYRNGGPLTVTDANVFLGRIQPDHFPHVFGADAAQAIDTDVVRRELEAVAAEMTAATGVEHDALRVASGAVRIAVERMAGAIRRISIERGHDAAEFALASFGGAGGQHACDVADALGIETIVLHPLAGVLSAFGMGLAELRTIRQQTVELPLEDTVIAELHRLYDALARDVEHDLVAQGVPSEAVAVTGRVHVKTHGSDTPLPLTFTPQALHADLAAAFATAHSRHFGFEPPAAPVVDSLEVEGIGTTASPGTSLGGSPGTSSGKALGAPPGPSPRASRSAAPAVRPVWFDGGWIDTPIHPRDSLPAGSTITGPALIVEPNATTVIARHWRAAMTPRGDLVLSRVAHSAAEERIAAATPDPIMLEVFNNLFMHTAEQMGAVLEQTAQSVNIKERLDFSCAVFDLDGGLIANAPHVPVHLGSMGDSVGSVLDRFRGSIEPGDVFMLNAPYQGGTHLPDITVVTPVFAGGGESFDFVVASRAHHADIGGTTPGSMPPSSRTIEEEGVVIAPVRIVARGRFLHDEVRALLTAARYPARNPEQNIADLKAQMAANARGASELNRIARRYGLAVVQAYMAHVADNAEACVRAAIDKLGDGHWTAEFDSGERVAVAVHIDRTRRQAIVDFAGTSPVSASNLNAPTSIARAAVLYVFRTQVGQNIPLNGGCLRPLTIRLPESSLVNPRYPAAVVAGNVETSQCITDALLATLGACAASQGTMNNFTFGNERYQYYETICGGAGAGPDFDGADAVHTHMTNSKLTDPEVLEWRYPVRIARFEIRRGSGGRGRRHGGDGVVREIEFLEPMHAAILSNRRRVAPFGLHGGSVGAPGSNRVIRASGRVEPLPGTAEIDLYPGDRFVLETPGGGGYGEAGSSGGTQRVSAPDSVKRIS